MQTLIIAGNVGKDGQLRHTQGGEPVLNFTLAVDNGKDANGNKREATWYDCAIWGKRATSLDGRITKGTKLVLQGRPTARAHDGKAYLGINVAELQFMGGGQRDDEAPPQRQASGAPAGGYGAKHDMDDDLPF